MHRIISNLSRFGNLWRGNGVLVAIGGGILRITVGFLYGSSTTTGMSMSFTLEMELETIQVDRRIRARNNDDQ